MIEFLKPGDTVSIVAPGRRVRSPDVDSAIRLFEQWGLNVQLGKNLFSDSHNYLSGTDEERLADLQQAFDDKSVKAIVCARGGYGTTRIIDALDLAQFKKSPKWVVGFSDVTALHLKLIANGYQSIHGPMPIMFSRPDFESSINSLKSVLFGDAVKLEALSNLKNKVGESMGNAIGGNLSLIVDSLGTSAEIQTDGRLLIVEEIDEYYYKLDRMFVQLARSGKLAGLAGLVVGHMTDIKNTDPGFGESIEDIVLNYAGKYSFPIAFNFPTGHDSPNLAWIENSTMRLTVSPSRSFLTQV